jgi:DNA-binding ferritin-like protein
MKLCLDYTSKRNLRQLIEHIPNETKKIKASIAYSSSSFLIDYVIKRNINFDWFGLFNAQVPTSPELIEKALSHKSLIRFYPLKGYFHPKLIHFEDYGVYIGSANMTDKALHYNIEAGVFINETEMNDEQKMELKKYFDELYKVSYPLTDEGLGFYKEFIEKKNCLENKPEIICFEHNLEESFDEYFPHIKKPVPAIRFQYKDQREETNKGLFIKKWMDTYDKFAAIMDFFRDSKNIPKWIKNQQYVGIIADQFLQAYYYYLNINEDNREQKLDETVHKKHNENKYRQEEAVREVLEWWKELKQAPCNENVYIDEWAPLNKGLLSKEKIKSLTQSELENLFLHIHSVREHARQIANKTLGFPENNKTTKEERVIRYSKWIETQKTKDGKGIRDTIYYLVYDNEALEEKVYKMRYDPDFKIDHFGLSIIGEIIGWALPEQYPLRNNRVDKALYALGYDVLIR